MSLLFRPVNDNSGLWTGLQWLFTERMWSILLVNDIDTHWDAKSLDTHQAREIRCSLRRDQKGESGKPSSLTQQLNGVAWGQWRCTQNLLLCGVCRLHSQKPKQKRFVYDSKYGIDFLWAVVATMGTTVQFAIQRYMALPIIYKLNLILQSATFVSLCSRYAYDAIYFVTMYHSWLANSRISPQTLPKKSKDLWPITSLWNNNNNNYYYYFRFLFS